MTASAHKIHSSHWGAFEAETKDGKLVDVRPFAKDAHPSPIIESMPDALYADSRVQQPMVRKSWLEYGPGAATDLRGADPFVAVEWNEASRLVADELQRVKDAYGNEAIFGGSYGWSSAGRFHHAKTQLKRFLNLFGGFTDQVYSYSNAAGHAILPRIVGHGGYGPFSSWDGIAEHTELFVAFGGVGLKNTQVEPGGAGEHATHKWLPVLKEKGVRFVNVAPCRDDTAEYLEAEWWPARPNSDVAIMLGLAHTLVENDLHDAPFLAKYCNGFGKFLPYLLGENDGVPKSAEWAAELSEIPAEKIRSLALEMAEKRTMIGCAYALQRADHGEQTYWMTITLAAMLGTIGMPGCGFGCGYGSMNGYGNPRVDLPAPTMIAGDNPTRSFIPVARISDMLLNPGAPYQFNGLDRHYPDTRLIYWCGGNPFHHHQDLNRLLEAWRMPDTIIVHEPWWTSTARHADIVLPATTTMERNDIGASGRDRFWMAMEQLVEPLHQAKNDFDIFTSIAEHLGFENAFTEGRDEREWIRHIYDVARQQAAKKKLTLPDFEDFWNEGYVETPVPDEPFVAMADFRADPKKHKRSTPSGKIEIFSETIDGFGYDDCPGHPVWLEPKEWLGSEIASRFPLHMVSNQPRTRLHAQMDHGKLSRESKIQGREPVRLSVEDANARGIENGDVVKIFNDRGALLAGALIVDTVRPGVVELSTGAWYDPLEPGKIGALDVHGNPNVLTPDHGTSKLGQGPSAHSTLVELEKFDEELPEITVFRQPTNA
ncbi:MAG: Asp-tRNA(Asn)/Glu-tRNA(Gln) amidotransferase GatCAB subunit C [Rhodospirillaceae bacterium]|nr:Asp-tRNA(Asn)/Glu-tRNA(Gln) amidotransferase GatCAB subunit C [Rhodospirillaceae bacterium]HAA91675.1 Asp-tRNA(Asn)/Glu-tRNA(Gln) amidotransferase GatCAB subunit C [Rhodospirillaceae bacterium]